MKEKRRDNKGRILHTGESQRTDGKYLYKYVVTDNYWEQIDLFSSVEKREKQMKMDSAVDEIRRRFGFYSIQRGLMYRDRILSAVNAKEEHTVHPHGYFG